MLYCRSVIANEELIVRLLHLVDPVFQYSTMSHAPSQFLSLDDNILDEIRRKSTAGLSPEHVQLVSEGKQMLSLLDRRLGPQHVQMARKVPSVLTQHKTASEISEVVRWHIATVLVCPCNTQNFHVLQHRAVPLMCAGCQ